MSITLKIIFILSSVTFFSGCFALRSAEGLAAGELNVNYVAPLAGSIRYGVTDNVEARFSIIGETYNYDLYLHTHFDSGHLNYGVMFGVNTIWDRKPFYYAGGMLGKKLNEYFSPYAALTGLYDTERKKIRMDQSYISIGNETMIRLFNSKVYLNLTPEVSFSINNRKSDIYSGWIFGAINIGLVVDVYSLFNK